MANAVQSQNPSKRKPNQTELLALLSYAPISGLLFWKDRGTGPGVRPAGTVAGTVRPDGYVHVGIWRRQFYAHCVIWCMITGDWPATQIDHENLIRSDNAWKNLRPATPSQNKANIRAINALNAKGIFQDPRTGRYRTKIGFQGKEYALGTFGSLEEARSAYDTAAKKFFGEYARAS